MSHPTPRVLIADDHAPTRRGVQTVLEEAGLTVCAQVADADAAIEAAVRERPDVCLLDINMPGDGLHAVAEIVRRVPGTTVLMLTVSTHRDDLLDALRNGADGFLPKDMDPMALPEAIRSALDGQVVVPRTLARHLVTELRRRGRRTTVTAMDGHDVELTRREWDVFELMCEGHRTSEIARRLFVSPVTVRRHIADILAKLGAATREEATRLSTRP